MFQNVTPYVLGDVIKQGIWPLLSLQMRTVGQSSLLVSLWTGENHVSVKITLTDSYKNMNFSTICHKPCKKDLEINTWTHTHLVIQMYLQK